MKEKFRITLYISSLSGKKTHLLPTENQNEFLYKIDEIPLIGNNDYRFSPDFSGKKTIYVNAVVGEANNKIERIILFFK